MKFKSASYGYVGNTMTMTITLVENGHERRVNITKRDARDIFATILSCFGLAVGGRRA